MIPTNEELSAEVREGLHRKVDWNMTNHAPKDPDIVERFEALREFAKNLGHAIIDLCPPSRDRDLALELVESALMRGTAAIARNQDAILDSLDDGGLPIGTGRDESGLPMGTDFFETAFVYEVDESPEKPPQCICEVVDVEGEEDGYTMRLDPECPAHPPQEGKTEEAEALEQVAEAALEKPVEIDYDPEGHIKFDLPLPKGEN